jgi:hypothetical protein
MTRASLSRHTHEISMEVGVLSLQQRDEAIGDESFGSSVAEEVTVQVIDASISLQVLDKEQLHLFAEVVRC